MVDGPKAKIFNDSIHGYIEMHPLCVAIIDTEQFQRLRCIKQMGGTYFVYPGASHNRFEHSIGTSYLAGYFVESLRRKQGKELDIEEKDVLCVKIAGLCHDLGHGPFSHMFDNDFIPKVRPLLEWSHEVASEKMFDHLIESNGGVKKMFEKNELGDKDICFIKKLMTGETPKSEEEWKEVGREKNKPRFLFEIVANKINGIDVDKWDYFARDCKYLGIKSSFEHMRCLSLARVIKSGKKGEAEICYRDIAAGNIYDLFHTRLSIHKKACQHKTVNAIEMMITEALVKADPHFKIKGENGREPSTISTAIDDMVAYTKLTDHVYYEILYSTKDELKEAREILQNIEQRKLYKFIGYTIPKDNPDEKGVPAMRKEIFDIVKENAEELKEDDIVVQLTPFKYGGTDDKDPVGKVRFYAKHRENESFNIKKEQVSRMLPVVFIEEEIRVYCKERKQPTVEKMKTAFLEWCTHRGYEVENKGPRIQRTDHNPNEVEHDDDKDLHLET
ncbi:deoxynucleoside triphosphate triphosphohydrolase SAMHD1-like isoform X3 [Actinia tenebrosa]|uniref:Deoxynucleoside triphosphate triphosphohydrolase SAMHD1-like isoform X3 n=1 Tax=Actinia tenebrosa TaxID=6105 RepID=A0A6P8IE42_ACTTE|nr:deoxynucleoside triphosphate triphosphohydrolase SAMHD1-like isoform X3 [Actinia tenebrosa]